MPTIAILATTKSLRTTVDGTLIVSFEVAPQDAAAAFTAFGLTGTNVGIAPITPDAAREATQRAAAEEPKEDRKSFMQKKRSNQAALRCERPDFWAFLEDRYHNGREVIHDKEDAAEELRKACGVKSRAEFDKDTRAGQCWDGIEADFYGWLHGRR